MLDGEINCVLLTQAMKQSFQEPSFRFTIEYKTYAPHAL